MKPIKFALIGTSGMAGAYCNILKDSSFGEVVSIHSRSIDRANRFAREHNISCSTDKFENPLFDNVEAVLICNEPSRHIETALSIMEWEKHILIEKPLALNVLDAKRLVESVLDYGKMISVVSQYRFDPILEIMKAEIKEMPRDAPITACLSFYKNRDADYYRHGNGWRSRASVFLNQGIHWLDVMNWFFGEPVDIKAKSFITRSFLDCADLSAALIVYSKNTSVVINGGTFSKIPNKEGFSIYHSEGVLDYETILQSNKMRSFIKKLRNRMLVKFGVSYQRIDPSEMMLRDFCDSIRGDRNSKTSLIDGYNALVLAEELSAFPTETYL